MDEEKDSVVLCGANSYEEKYYFNEQFSNIPEDVKSELKAMCVLFTENCGGILTLEYLRDGSLVFRTRVDDYDFYYDEIESGLQIGKLRKEKEKLLSALEMYYRAVVLKEGI